MEIKIKFYAYHYLTRNDEFKRLWGHDFNLFKEQVGQLSKTCNPLGINELLECSTSGVVDLPKKNFILTFDDGLKEHSKIIGPYLEKIGVTAIFFVPSSILHGQPAVSQIIPCGTAYYGIRKFYKIIVKYLCDRVSEPEKYLVRDANNLGIYELHAQIKNIFRVELSHKKSYEILSAFWHSELKKDVPDVFEKIYMSKEDIKRLVESGHSIGIHSKTHPVLNDSSYSEAVFQEEIADPKKELEEITGKSIEYFAYPYGGEDHVYYGEDIIDKIKKTGVKFFFTTFQKTNYFDPHFIGRHLVYSNHDKLIDTKGCEQLKQNKEWYYSFNGVS